MRICTLSLSRIADDGRVRRAGERLLAAGHEVSGVGLAGAKSSPPAFPVAEVPPADWSVTGRVGRSARLAVARLGRRAALASLRRMPELQPFRRAAAAAAADAYHANDWIMLGPALEAAERNGAVVVYDSHEYAVEERLERRAWRLLYPPMIKAAEREGFARVAASMTVADGIAERLRRDYALPEAPLVVRNVPWYADVASAPHDGPIRMLFHGILLPDRGLEVLIDSVIRWEPGRTLTIRGDGEPGYVSSLRDRAASSGSKVTFEGAVAPARVIEEAAAFDVGIHVPSGGTFQSRHQLPNKLFEYVMAGLAVVVTDLPEMAAVVRGHGVGIVADGFAPDDVARAVNRLDRAEVERLRAASRGAAHELCWEREGEKLVALYERLSPSPSR